MRNSVIDFLPCLKAGDSYAGWLNEAVRFGGFPLHGRLRCGRFAPASVLRRFHGRLATRQVLPRRVCSMRRSSHGRAPNCWIRSIIRVQFASNRFFAMRVRASPLTFSVSKATAWFSPATLDASLYAMSLRWFRIRP